MLKNIKIFKISIVGLFFVLFATTNNSFSFMDDVCVDNIINYNICDKAIEIQEEFATQLPQQISENLILRTIASNENMLIMNALLLYNRSYLEAALRQHNRTMESINAQMNQSTHNMMCSMTPINDFVYLGGGIVVNYNFEDGEHYLTINVDNCE
tara:strand:- start:85 stop:549 length:465 start_codon:yes stop_codon:yes gene_type:complete